MALSTASSVASMTASYMVLMWVSATNFNDRNLLGWADDLRHPIGGAEGDDDLAAGRGRVRADPTEPEGGALGDPVRAGWRATERRWRPRRSPSRSCWSDVRSAGKRRSRSRPTTLPSMVRFRIRPQLDMTRTPTLKLRSSSSMARDEVPMPPAKSKLIMPVPAPTDPCGTGPAARGLEGLLRVLCRSTARPGCR